MRPRIYDHEAIVRDASDMTCFEISKKYNTSVDAIKQILCKEHVKAKRIYRIWDKEELESLSKALTVENIAEKYHVKVNTMKVVLTRLHVKYICNRRLVLKMFDWKKAEGMPLKMIADKLGVSDSAVCHYMKRHGIPGKNRRDA